MIYIGFEEEWKKIIIDNQETIYSISNFARVRNDETGLIKKHTVAENKRHFVTLNIDGESVKKLVYRLVAEAFIPIPEKYLKLGYNAKSLEVDHIRDGDPENHDDNSVFNLQWLTKRENIIKASQAGLYKSENKKYKDKNREKKESGWGRPGEKNPSSVYTEKQIREICELLVENKLNAQEIADKVGVKKGLVHDVRIGRAWKHVSKEYDFSHYDRKIGLQYEPELLKNLDILINMDATNKQIREILKLDNDKTVRALISSHRKKLGKNITVRTVYDPQILQKIDEYIIAGKTNNEIKSQLNLVHEGRTDVLLSAHRRRLSVPAPSRN
jgi:predicted DNA-binding protein YlxM (UPF0122 family)